MTSDNQHPSTWWGKFSLETGQTAQWHIGPLKLAVQRWPDEWQIGYETDASIDLESSDWNHHPAGPDLSELNLTTTERFVVDETGETLWVMPALADRALITRPFTPIYVPAGETTNFFVSSPLWVSIEIGDPPQPLKEMPIRRPSDTWFGPSTMEGELCYASRTQGRLSLENMPLIPERANTQVVIQNRAASQLLIERLSLPVPYLSLYETSAGILWTQTVTMDRPRDTAMVVFQVETGPPRLITEANLIHGPRQQPVQNMVIRAFGVLFH